jgi:hypothetical protein
MELEVYAVFKMNQNKRHKWKIHCKGESIKTKFSRHVILTDGELTNDFANGNYPDCTQTSFMTKNNEW